nr:hypothetical protein GCM10025730_43360 [Promicromonospora thailandica]
MRPPFLLGYGTNGFGDHPLHTALDVLDDVGYDAVALTLGFPHLDPFAPGAPTEVAALRAHLARMRGGRGAAVVVETGTRYLLDPLHKHRPTLVDRDASLRIRFLERAVEIAAELDARCVSFFSGILPDDASPPTAGPACATASRRWPATPGNAGCGSRSSRSPACSSRPSTTRCGSWPRRVSRPSWGSRSTSGTAWWSSPAASRARCAPPRPT